MVKRVWHVVEAEKLDLNPSCALYYLHYFVVQFFICEKE